MSSKKFVRYLKYLWAAPNTFLGLVLCAAGWLSGSKISVRGGIVEGSGGLIAALLRSRLFRAQALTLGHVILARGPVSMEALRSHEMVHVHQYELLGPLFLPAYALASLKAALSGGHYYRDNAFEVEARRIGRASPW